MTTTTETIEKKKKAPTISNDAMLAVAELASGSVRFNWSKDEYDRDQIQLYFEFIRTDYELTFVNSAEKNACSRPVQIVNGMRRSCVGFCSCFKVEMNNATN